MQEMFQDSKKFIRMQAKTRPAWAGFKTAEEGRANTPFGVGEPFGPRGEVNPQK
jgi:hypothetical protein